MINTIRIVYLVFAITLVFGCSKSENPDTTGEKIEETPDEQNILVVAHRGAWKEFNLPENSIASLNKAIEIGSNISECDIQLTKDLQVVIFHDEMVRGKYIKEQTYSELSQFSLSNGEKIPLLSTYLDIVIENKFKLWLDIKSLSELAGNNAWSIKAGEEAAKVIENKNAQQYVSFIVGRMEVLDKCIGFAKGNWECAYMNADFTSAQFVSKGYSWANFSFEKFYQNNTTNNSQLITDYTSKKIKVSVYTIDDNTVMDWFLDQNSIYAISTNLPFKLLSKF
ncbi:MAG: hypothetical protein KDC67_04985 [Ignavibacteriae bacterium]|nr:hypothetical protein [Ignavibacteriota bacterium]